MKRLLLLLCVVLVMTGCAPVASAQPIQPDGSGQDDYWYIDLINQELDEQVQMQALPETGGLFDDGVEAVAYNPMRTLSMEETIEAYFEQMYKSYTSNSYVDLSSIMDTTDHYQRNLVNWTKTLLLRRKLIQQNKYCYVETNKFSYKITYLKESQIKDQRISKWSNIDLPGDTMVHFTITGTKGNAYPPIMAMNSQHSMRLQQENGRWKIMFHYFPGSVRKFYRSNTVKVPTSSDMLDSLKAEFGASSKPAVTAVPSGTKAYNGSYAVKYAKAYTESNNPYFYNVGDWMGNCANFTSQCIWYGFSDGNGMPSVSGRANMTTNWYAGDGGATPAWENVGRFWEYATGDNQLGGLTFRSVKALKPGDLVQIKTQGSRTYNHSFIVVDSDKLILAQNSPGAFVYYSDLVNFTGRFMRPHYLKPSTKDD